LNYFPDARSCCFHFSWHIIFTYRHIGYLLVDLAFLLQRFWQVW
jgi:hypothetical protein